MYFEFIYWFDFHYEEILIFKTLKLTCLLVAFVVICCISEELLTIPTTSNFTKLTKINSIFTKKKKKKKKN